MSTQFALFKYKRFSAMFATQFLGAFNDNVFKQGLILVLTFMAAAKLGMRVSLLIGKCGHHARIQVEEFLFTLAPLYEPHKQLINVEAAEQPIALEHRQGAAGLHPMQGQQFAPPAKTELHRPEGLQAFP